MEAMLDTMRTEAEVLLHCAFLLCYQIDLDRGGEGGGQLACPHDGFATGEL